MSNAVYFGILQHSGAQRNNPFVLRIWSEGTPSPYLPHSVTHSPTHTYAHNKSVLIYLNWLRAKFTGVLGPNSTTFEGVLWGNCLTVCTNFTFYCARRRFCLRMQTDDWDSSRPSQWGTEVIGSACFSFNKLNQFYLNFYNFHTILNLNSNSNTFWVTVVLYLLLRFKFNSYLNSWL